MPSREELLLEIKQLRQELASVQREKADLEIVLETTTEHADTVEAELHFRALEAVRESEHRLAQFLEAVPVGITVIDAKGKFLFFNHTAQTLLGRETMPDICPEKISETYQVYLAGSDRIYPNEQLPIIRALGGESSTVDDIEIRVGNKVIPLEVWGTPIFNSNGDVMYAIVAFQDITHRKQAQAEQEQFKNQLLRVNSDLQKALDAEFQLTDAYGRFVPHEFLHFLGYESIVDVKLGDQVLKEMSILFSDIRDFTSLSENMSPEDTFKFINAYLSRMEPAIIENNGFIDKYIGDAIMALFSGSADDAVQAGIAMLNILTEYNQHRANSSYPPIKIGIGINTGSLMLGTVGGHSRMDSTVISDAVNLASRLEGLTKNYQVPLLISRQTFERLQAPQNYLIRLIERVQVKGKSELVSVFEVFDADPLPIREGKASTRQLFEEALWLYSIQSFREATQLLQRCLKINPGDQVTRIYLGRCQLQMR